MPGVTHDARCERTSRLLVARLEAVAQSDELFLPLIGRRTLHAFQIIHGRSADGARHFPGVIHHGKQQHHPVVFVTSDVTAHERHAAFFPEWNKFRSSFSLPAD